MENSGALDITTPSPNKMKGKTRDIDLTSVIWMKLIAECYPQKPVDLSELKSARIRSVFPINRCISNKDITNVANWELGAMHTGEGMEGNLGGSQCAPE